MSVSVLFDDRTTMINTGDYFILAFSKTPPLWKECDWTTNIAIDGKKRKNITMVRLYNDYLQAHLHQTFSESMSY